MPLNISVNNPAAYANAVLEVEKTMDEIMAGLTGLIGLWTPSSLPDGPVSTLSPIYGDSPLTAANTVTKTTLGGEAALTFGTNSRMADIWNASVGSGSLFAKFYLQDPVPDLQNIIGPAGQRIVYRSEGSSFPTGVHLSATTDITGMALSPPDVGWHTAEMYLGGGRIIVNIDGTDYISDPWDGILNGNVIFGNQPSASSETSIAMGPMFAANDYLHGTDAADAIRAYLFG